MRLVLDSFDHLMGGAWPHFRETPVCIGMCRGFPCTGELRSRNSRIYWYTVNDMRCGHPPLTDMLFVRLMWGTSDKLIVVPKLILAHLISCDAVAI